MSDITLIMLGAGGSTRFGLPVKKQWLWIGEKPLWLYVTDNVAQMADFAKIIVTAHPQEAAFYARYCDYEVIAGGASRQASIANALQKVTTPYVLISDIARACIQPQVLANMLDARDEGIDCIAPFVPSPDTVVYKNETIDREQVKLIQTPQLSRTQKLREAITSEKEFTDESSAIKAVGGNVLYVPGDVRQRKLTYKEDLFYLPCLKAPAHHQRIGQGFDVHAFCAERPLMLCGVQIDYDKGLAGHSDADVAIHALIDALLGAAGFGDIGELFPDNDARYEGIASTQLLEHVASLLRSCGFVIDNIDLTIMAQAPKLAPYKKMMQRSIAQILRLATHKVNIKATTTEKLGFVGRKEGIAAQAIATLHYYDWSEA